MAERMIEANDVEICTEAFGDPADPAIILIMGSGASMLWWDERFCRMLAEGGRFVIRYDHRDTGRSTTYPVGRPEYTGADLVADAVAVLDGYGVPAAHIVGVSMGGALAQVFALDYADRVRSLVLISTSFAVPTDRELPASTQEFARFATSAEADWSDPESVIEYLVGYSRVLAGDREFDEAALRQLVRRDIARSRNYAAAQNHDALRDDGRLREPLSSISVPALVIHGTGDPLFPPGHAQALAAEIPDARLFLLAGAGHGVDRADWEAIAAAILEHTSAGAG